VQRSRIKNTDVVIPQAFIANRKDIGKTTLTKEHYRRLVAVGAVRPSANHK